MFGWELPPYNSGGLGTACLGLTEGLSSLDVDIDFVVPKVFGDFPFNHMRVHSAADYATLEEIRELLGLDTLEQELIARSLGYGNRIAIDENKRLSVEGGAGSIPVTPHHQATWYAYQAAAIAKEKKGFEVIHCHDWMTYYCGIAAKELAKAQGRDVPFVAHIHAAEFDRCGINSGDPAIVEIEKKGLHAADRVVAVSHYTKHMVHKHYGVPLEKISVVHNGIPSHRQPPAFDFHELKRHFKIVLFMGRITMQKGPDYFVQLAKKVTDQDPTVKFVMVGSGDMEKRCIEQAAKAGLTGKILFSSFLRGTDVDRAYQLADLFVMPSVSEPFGIVALEAMQNGTPALVSKQSGCLEVSPNMLAVDFWDIEGMAGRVLDVLQNPDFATQLKEAGKEDVKHLTWDKSAEKMREIYAELVTAFKPRVLALAPAIAE